MKIYTNTSTEFYNPLFPKKTLEGKQKKDKQKTKKTVERQKNVERQKQKIFINQFIF